MKRRFIVKQKFFSFGGDMIIKDESGQPFVKVAGKVFSIGLDMSMRDLYGRELAQIKSEVFSMKVTLTFNF